MGIFNSTFSHSGNRKSTIGNGEEVHTQNGPKNIFYVKWIKDTIIVLLELKFQVPVSKLKDIDVTRDTRRDH